MQGQNLWISFVVTLQIASALCQTRSYEIATEEKYAGDTYRRGDPVESVKLGLSIAAGAVTILLFICLTSCICYRYILRCRKQTNYSGLIVAPRPVNIVQVVQQHSPQQASENGQNFPQQNQPTKQPECPPMQHFPPEYKPVQQFAPHDHPMQQFSPQNQPMQQFSPQHSPMQQFSPQNQPMQQFSPQHSPMQQFTPQNQPKQQFSPQHSPMQQFQQSASQNQSSSSENLISLSEPPPAYEHDLPRKY